MPGDELFSKLKNELAELYDSPEKIREVLRDEGIPVKDVNLQGSASEIWSRLPETVPELDKWLDLVKTARRNYFHREVLQEAERKLEEEKAQGRKKMGLPPEILKAYLEYLVESNRTLRLPDSTEVELERVYVSLRADAMNAKEREAENELFLEDVAALVEQSGGKVEDLYAHFGALRKAVARHPRMKLLQTRSWEKLLSIAEQRSMNLAEVVQQHKYAVLLGDPGSGKTTLGRWLTLQYARALAEGQERLEVPLDLVKPGERAGKVVDLGPSRLPIFIRVVDYAKARWPKGEGDQEITLEDFIGRQHRNLPRGVSQEAVTKLAWSYLEKGLALVVLDGLDEVGDPGQRRAVMQAVNKIIQKQEQSAGVGQWSGNRVLLTSRIVGYQFQPLTHMPHYIVEDMDEAAIGEFCRAWMNGVVELEVQEVEEQASKLKAAIFDHAHPGVRTLAGNPLLLTILAQVYWESAERALPARRVTLFEEASKMLYKQREAFWDGARITHLRLTRALAAVAYEIHAHEVSGFAEEGTVRAALERVLSDPEDVEAVLEAAREVSGFLVARGEGVYGFLHRSLQEYFAAWYLTENPAEVAQRLGEVALDPTWREPVVLGVGMVSQRGYSDSRRRLKEVFESLMQWPDPAGEFLPRRELLIVAAFEECERIPEGVSSQIAERLLGLYAAQDGRGKSPVLRKRIQQAFKALKEGQGKEEVEGVLSRALLEPDFEQRYGAVELVLIVEWWTAGIARVLVESWKSYDGPAASILEALDRCFKARPEYFRERDFLKFRCAVETDPELWRKALKQEGWQIIIRMLYLSQEAEFEIEMINRDSPLTEMILRELKQEATDEELKKKLQEIVSKVSTAEGRDAALALSCLGEQNWIDIWVEQTIDKSVFVFRPIMACLIRTLAREHDHDLAHAFDLAFASDLAPDLTRVRDRVIAYAFDRAFARTRDLARAQALSRNREPAVVGGTARALARDLVRDRDLARALARDLALARVRDHDLALNLARIFNRYVEIEQFVAQAEVKWFGNSKISEILGKVLNQVRFIKTILETGNNIGPTIEKLVRIIETSWPEEVKSEEENEQESSATAHKFVPIYHQTMSLTLTTLPTARLEAVALSLKNLEEVLDELESPDDRKREQAREVLVKERKASVMGKELIEQMVVLRRKAKGKFQVDTQLGWAFSRIEHDRVDWLVDWIREANQEEGADQAAIARKVLSEIRKVSNEGLEIIAEALPGTRNDLNEVLLEAVGWLARLGRIEAKSEAGLRKKLLFWLEQEKEESLRKALIKRLGYWQYGEAELFERLRRHIGRTAVKEERAVVYEALAQLGRRKGEVSEQIWEELSRICKMDGLSAGAGLVRLAVYRQNLKRTSSYLRDEKEREKERESRAKAVLEGLRQIIVEPGKLLVALLEAGTDDDVWDESYHEVLVRAARALLEEQVELLAELMKHLQMALEKQNWQVRRMLLAVVAACSEVMPTSVQKACPSVGKLEGLLVKGTTDAESFSSRRFALTALSYLRAVTPAVVPALLAGCQDVEVVQKDAIAAAGRFQELKGDPLPELAQALRGESAKTAYAVALILGALGASVAGEASQLRVRISEVLVEALKDPKTRDKVAKIGKEEKRLEDTLYTALLQTAGWQG